MVQPLHHRVLVVDDDPAILKVIRGFLKPVGLELVEAADGDQAIQLLESSTFDLICLDLMLPKSSGYTVCEHVRRGARHKDVPILVISARALPSDRAEAEELGASAYLTKPFTKAALTQHVRTLLKLGPAPGGTVSTP
jgi:two-component system, OmpR family, response regulator